MILRDRHDPEDFSHWDARGTPPEPRLLSVLAVLVLMLAALAIFADIWLPAFDASQQWLDAPR